MSSHLNSLLTACSGYSGGGTRERSDREAVQEGGKAADRVVDNTGQQGGRGTGGRAGEERVGLRDRGEEREKKRVRGKGGGTR